MTTTTHTFTDNKSVVDFFEKSMKQAQRDFTKSPNSTRWNNMIRKQFAYQQAYYALYYNAKVNTPRNQQLIDDLNDVEALGNYGDILCKAIYDKPMSVVLSEAGITVY